MQAPTHLLTGILIQKRLIDIQPLPLQYSLVASLAFLSNGVLDRLGKITYHPQKPIWKDKFWFAYHLSISFLTILIVLKYWESYKLGLIFSILPDLEWIGVHLLGENQFSTRAFFLF